MAEYYGVSAIPTAILVDRKGKVVEMMARGDVLRTKLNELLGDPDSGYDERTSRPTINASESFAAPSSPDRR